MTEANPTAAGGTMDRASAADEAGRDRVDEASAESMDASDPPAFGGATGVGAGPDAGEARHAKIAARAHELWLEARCPDGRSVEFWLLAERELAAEGTIG
jgi:hypothetical protein